MHFSFAGQAVAKIDEIASVNRVGEDVYVNLCGSDEYGKRVFFRVSLDSEQDAEELVTEFIVASKEWAKS